MDADEAAPAPAPYYGCLRSLKRHSTKLFSGLAVLLATAGVMFIALLSCFYRSRPLSQLLSCAVFLIVFYGALYLHRRLRGRYQHAWLRRGLGYLAAAAGALMSLLFLTSLHPAIRSWQEAIGAWLVLAVAAYCFYRILVLHLDEEEHAAAAAAAAQVQAQARGAGIPAV